MNEPSVTIELIVDQDFVDKLYELRELMRDEVPDGDLNTIMNIAIKEFLEKFELGSPSELSADS